MAREIILRAPIQRPDEGSNIAAIVLVRLTHNDITPYVTWVEGKDGETYWGNYHRTYSEAEADFKSRCESYGAEHSINCNTNGDPR